MANQNQGNQGNDRSKQGAQAQGNSGGGFASMDPQRQREIASQGGKAAHASGNAHEFDSEEAREAGAKSHGGQGAQASNSGSSDRGSSSERGGSDRGSNSDRGNNASSGTRGGSSEQHAAAGRQSHKNDR